MSEVLRQGANSFHSIIRDGIQKQCLKKVWCNLKNEILPVLLLVYDNSLGVLTRKNSQVNSDYEIDKSNIFWYHFLTTFDIIVDDGVIPKPPIDHFFLSYFL